MTGTEIAAPVLPPISVTDGHRFVADIAPLGVMHNGRHTKVAARIGGLTWRR